MMIHQRHHALTAVLCLCALMGTYTTSAFTPSLTAAACNRRIELHMSSFFADATPPKETIVAVQRDADGNAISVGQTVAIVSHNSIMAHHVAKSAYGSFDSTTKQFLPQDEANLTRKTSCLLLPEGLRGEVITVYDTNGCDRTHPILVKFGADEDRGDGYTLPSSFTMHLAANEVMVV